MTFKTSMGIKVTYFVISYEVIRNDNSHYLDNLRVSNILSSHSKFKPLSIFRPALILAEHWSKPVLCM